MQWTLMLLGQPGGTAIDCATVTVSDEFLCGNCGALLAIDHRVWSNADATSGDGLICSVCHAVNDNTRGTTDVP